MNRSLLRGSVLIAISLAFGLTALRYPTGELAHAGAGHRILATMTGRNHVRGRIILLAS